MSQYEMVLANTNIILSGADPEFLSQDLDQAVLQVLGAGQALAELSPAWPPTARRRPPRTWSPRWSPRTSTGSS